jgi:hypothetical protein
MPLVLELRLGITLLTNPGSSKTDKPNISFSMLAAMSVDASYVGTKEIHPILFKIGIHDLYDILGDFPSFFSPLLRMMEKVVFW